jgi:hypothetical protein
LITADVQQCCQLLCNSQLIHRWYQFREELHGFVEFTSFAVVLAERLPWIGQIAKTDDVLVRVYWSYDVSSFVMMMIYEQE